MKDSEFGRYYRVDIIDEDEGLITVCTTTDREEAERQYDIWNKTHRAVMHELHI